MEKNQEKKDEEEGLNNKIILVVEPSTEMRKGIELKADSLNLVNDNNCSKIEEENKKEVEELNVKEKSKEEEPNKSKEESLVINSGKKQSEEKINEKLNTLSKKLNNKNRNNKQSSEDENKTQKDEETDKLNSEDFEEMTFGVATRRDTREFKKILSQTLFSKMVIVQLIFEEIIFVPILLKVSIIVFYILSLYFLNGLLYTIEYIEKDFYGNISIKEKISDILSRSTLAAFFLVIIIKILSLIVDIQSAYFKFKEEVEECSDEKENALKEEDMKKILNSKMNCYFILTNMLSLIYFYYNASFGNLYPNTVIKVVYSTAISIFINLLLEFILCFLFVFFRFIGVRIKSM